MRRERFLRVLAKIMREYDLGEDVIAEALRIAEKL